jgi:hypothetical protein
MMIIKKAYYTLIFILFSTLAIAQGKQVQFAIGTNGSEDTASTKCSVVIANGVVISGGGGGGEGLNDVLTINPNTNQGINFGQANQFAANPYNSYIGIWRDSSSMLLLADSLNNYAKIQENYGQYVLTLAGVASSPLISISGPGANLSIGDNQLSTTGSTTPLEFNNMGVLVPATPVGNWYLPSGHTAFNDTIVGTHGVDSMIALLAPVIVAHGREVSQTATTTVATYKVGSIDTSIEVSGNVCVQSGTSYSFTLTITYTNEKGIAQTEKVVFAQSTGLVSTISNITGTGSYAGCPLSLRCGAATTVTISAIGTFTSVIYNVEVIIKLLP